MARVLSMREQVDCLIMALESNLENMRSYMSVCDKGIASTKDMSLLNVHNHGMKAGVEYCAEMIERTLEAAKKQRERWNNA